MKITHFENGLTVKELKELIKCWPDLDEDGEDTEVWISNGCGESNICYGICPLNDNDILFE